MGFESEIQRVDYIFPGSHGSKRTAAVAVGETAGADYAYDAHTHAQVALPSFDAQESVDWSALPLKAWSIIINQLKMHKPSIAASLQTSWEFKQIVSNVLTSLQLLSLPEDNAAQATRLVKSFPALENLTLGRFRSQLHSLPDLSLCSRLCFLHLRSAGGAPYDRPMASLPPCLRTLWLSTCTVTPREARALSEQTQLRSLIIRFCDFVPGPSHSNSRQHSGGGLGNRRSSGEEDTLGEDPQLLVSTLDEFDIAARLTKLQELTVLRWEPSSANVCAISSLVHLTKLRTDNCLPFPSVSLPLAVDDDDTGSAADPLTGGSAAFQVAPQTGWGFLKRLTKLEHLAIGGYRFGHLSVECRLDALRQLSRLTNLLLRNVCSLDDDLWAWTARMPQLQILEIAGCSVTGHPEVPPADEDGRKPILQRLTLGGLQELTHVPACFHDLQFLELNNCHSLIQSSLRRVAHCTALRAVHFANCNVSDQGLSYLKALKNLQELDISKTMVQGEALKELQCAASLTSLEAFSTLQFDCQHLTRFSSLRRLSICHSTAVSDRTLVPVLSTLSQLTMLRLEHLPQISSQGEHPAKPETRLLLLWLPQLPALCGVSRLPNLQTLWVMRNTGVDDGTMRHISCGLSGTLRWLDVSDCCLLTAAGLLQLRDMAALRLLEVARIPAVDKPLLQKLMEALPSCSIEA